MKSIAIILLLGSVGWGQVSCDSSGHDKLCGNVKAAEWLPSACKVGDVTDSYAGNWFMCASGNKWSKLSYPEDTGRECSLRFRDVHGIAHCPFETASGRVVACEPCKAGNEECASWHKRCERFVELQKQYKTAEPTIISENAISDDHSTGWRCAEGWELKRLGADMPVCIQPKPRVCRKGYTLQKDGRCVKNKK